EKVEESSIKDIDIQSLILKSNTSLDGHMLTGLVRHLKVAIERIQNKLPVSNPYTQDIKRSFPLSFDEAIGIKKSIEEFYQISIPEDEVAYIAVHIQAQREQLKLSKDSKLKVLLVCSSGKG
ncbi:PRD domain-containing protein, partial [Alkalihalophilus lindianensis]